MEPRFASLNVTLDPVTSAPVTLPEALFGQAQALMLGVRILATPGSEACVAHAHLSGQVLEGLLKAYLAARGMTVKKLKQPDVRHNLRELWMRAKNCGLPIDPIPPPWVECLSGLYDRPFKLRYNVDRVNGFVLPGLHPMTEALEQLLEDVRKQIR